MQSTDSPVLPRSKGAGKPRQHPPPLVPSSWVTALPPAPTPCLPPHASAPSPAACLAQPGGTTLFLRGAQPCQQQQGAPSITLVPTNPSHVGSAGTVQSQGTCTCPREALLPEEMLTPKTYPRGEPCPPQPPEGCPAGAGHAPIQL